MSRGTTSDGFIRPVASWVVKLLIATPLAFLAALLVLVLVPPEQPIAGRLVAVAFGGALILMAIYARCGLPPHKDLAHVSRPGPNSRPLSWTLLLLAVLVAFPITFPRLMSIDDVILGNTGDAGLNIYLIEWQMHAVVREPASYFDASIFDPERFTLVWSPTMATVVPAYALLKALTSSIVLSFNLLMVAVTFMTLVATFWFLRVAGFSQLSCALGALLFATTAQRLAHLSHLDSFQTFWVPLTGLMILRTWDRDRISDGILLGLTLAGSLLSAPYYFIGGLVLVGATVLISALRRKTAIDQSRAQPRRGIPVKAILAAAGVIFLLGGPVALMSRLAGLKRSPEDVFPITWADFFHPGAYTPSMGWLSNRTGQLGGGKTLENWLFPSLPLVILGAVGSWVCLRYLRKRICPLPDGHGAVLTGLMSASAVGGLAMAVGPELHLGVARLPLPMFALMRLPGFESIRVTGRFMALVFLPLTVLAVVGLEALFFKSPDIFKSKRSLPMTSGSGVFSVLLATAIIVSTLTFQPLTPLEVSGASAAVNKRLATLPRGLVVELPWPGCPGEGCLYTEPPRMVWSRFDWFPRLGGYSGYIPKYWPRAQESLSDFPSDRSLAFLNSVGADYVILRVSSGEKGAHFSAETATDVAKTALRVPQISSVERVGRDYLLRLRR